MFLPVKEQNGHVLQSDIWSKGNKFKADPLAALYLFSPINLSHPKHLTSSHSVIGILLSMTLDDSPDCVGCKNPTHFGIFHRLFPFPSQEQRVSCLLVLSAF